MALFKEFRDMNTGIKIGRTTVAFKHVTHVTSYGEGKFSVVLTDGRELEFTDEKAYNRLVNYLITGHPIEKEYREAK